MAGVTVAEVSAPYVNYMYPPAMVGPGICPICRGFPNEPYSRCRGCSRFPDSLDAILPITYAPALEQMHLELRGYKDEPREEVRRRFARGLTAVLWRFLRHHETCLARAAGVQAFDVVT